MDHTKLAAARLKAGQTYPFLAVALYALSPVEVSGLGTFAVDERWRLFIDPEALDRWSVDEVAGVLLHEVSHVVRFHSERARKAFVDQTTAVLWNVAADAEINDDLVHDGVQLPNPLLPKSIRQPSGKAAEFYFQRLLALSIPPNLDDPGCGDGAHGVSEIGHGLADHAMPTGLSPDEASLLRRRVALEVLSGRRAGAGSQGWSRWADGFLEPVVDWRRVFGATVRGAFSAVVSGRTDYRYVKPSRRRVPNVVLPSLVRPVPRVAVVIDTSASVLDAELSRAWTEVLAMMRSIGVRSEQIRLWSTDTVARRITLRPGERIELFGGGGTNMSAGIDAALADRPRPDVIVVLTDGETPWPVQQPPRPVVVGLFHAPGAHFPAPPPWAKVVDIPVDPAALL